MLPAVKASVHLRHLQSDRFTQLLLLWLTFGWLRIRLVPLQPSTHLIGSLVPVLLVS
jgi:hypothetical protein